MQSSPAASRLPQRRASADPLLREALERSARRGEPGGEGFDLARQREVLLGDTAGAVRLELDHHLRPADAQVRVVKGGLGAVADGVDQHQRVRPARRLERAADPAFAELPLGQRSESVLDLVLGEDLVLRHGASLYLWAPAAHRTAPPLTGMT